MSCLIARAEEMFDELLFTPIAARAAESRRSYQTRGLFDLSVKPIRSGRFDPPRPRREEDTERWDGLS